MTNYNARLDDTLDDFGWTCIANGGDGYGLQNEDVSEAKKALTSLIKELVAEAKPEEYEDYYATDPVEKGRKMGYNEAAREFELNLLKALEEV